MGDFNGDGNADLVVADPLARQVWLLIGTGSGAFGPPATVLERIPANMVLVRDLDRDGRLDLIVAYKDPCDLKGGVAVLKGYGDGTFSTRTDYPTPGGSYGVALADLHGNGNFDLVTANGTNTVSIFLGARDGTFVSRADFATILSPYTVAVGDLDGDGRRDLVVGSLSGSSVSLLFNRGGTSIILGARAFTRDGHRTIPLTDGPSQILIQYEPVEGDYQNSDVDLSSLRLTSTGTGAVGQISAVTLRRIVESDTDRDGSPELTAGFNRSDLARLFSAVRGRHTVEVSLEGKLQDGRKFRGPLSLTILGTGKPNRIASVAPNPLNPRTTLTISLGTAGRVTVRIYDISGRSVRTVVTEQQFPAGDHQIKIDGRDERGTALASGVYFYRVETPDGITYGRFVVAK